METKVLHKSDCNRVFKKYDHSCPRCQELLNGSPAREAWFTPAPHCYYAPAKDCGHNAINPGGYCNVCHAGRDFS